MSARTRLAWLFIAIAVCLGCGMRSASKSSAQRPAPAKKAAAGSAQAPEVSAKAATPQPPDSAGASATAEKSTGAPAPGAGQPKTDPVPVTTLSVVGAMKLTDAQQARLQDLMRAAWNAREAEVARLQRAIDRIDLERAMAEAAAIDPRAEGGRTNHQGARRAFASESARHQTIRNLNEQQQRLADELKAARRLPWRLPPIRFKGSGDEVQRLGVLGEPVTVVDVIDRDMLVVRDQAGAFAALGGFTAKDLLDDEKVVTSAVLVYTVDRLWKSPQRTRGIPLFRPADPQPDEFLRRVEPFVGQWRIPYDVGSLREYRIDRFGCVASWEEVFHGGNTGRVYVNGGDTLLRMTGDVLLERIKMEHDAMVVEHFRPGTDYPGGKPHTIGRGTRVTEEPSVPGQTRTAAVGTRKADPLAEATALQIAFALKLTEEQQIETLAGMQSQAKGVQWLIDICALFHGDPSDEPFSLPQRPHRLFDPVGRRDPRDSLGQQMRPVAPFRRIAVMRSLTSLLPTNATTELRYADEPLWVVDVLGRSSFVGRTLDGTTACFSGFAAQGLAQNQPVRTSRIMIRTGQFEWDSPGGLRVLDIFEPCDPQPLDLLAIVRRFEGQWTLHYDNATTRRYTVDGWGRLVNDAGTGLEQGVLFVQDGEVLMRLAGDGKLERFSLLDNQLLVDHFNPALSYASGQPATRARGTRSPRAAGSLP